MFKPLFFAFLIVLVLLSGCTSSPPTGQIVLSQTEPEKETVTDYNAAVSESFNEGALKAQLTEGFDVIYELNVTPELVEVKTKEFCPNSYRRDFLIPENAELLYLKDDLGLLSLEEGNEPQFKPFHYLGPFIDWIDLNYYSYVPSEHSAPFLVEAEYQFKPKSSCFEELCLMMADLTATSDEKLLVKIESSPKILNYSEESKFTGAKNLIFFMSDSPLKSECIFSYPESQGNIVSRRGLSSINCTRIHQIEGMTGLKFDQEYFLGFVGSQDFTSGEFYAPNVLLLADNSGLMSDIALIKLMTNANLQNLELPGWFENGLARYLSFRILKNDIGYAKPYSKDSAFDTKFFGVMEDNYSRYMFKKFFEKYGDDKISAILNEYQKQNVDEDEFYASSEDQAEYEYPENKRLFNAIKAVIPEIKGIDEFLFPTGNCFDYC